VIDFSSTDYLHNFAARGRQKDPLARALGLNKQPDLRILDMSAGLGKDALWMAHCGASVVMIERHPVLAYLLGQAILRSSQQGMSVHCLSAQDYLIQAQEKFDVAYYDPMFEPRKKSALVKKDMQILQAMHGEEKPDPALITLALQYAKKVAVKRAKSDPPLLPNPHHSITTTVTRFDVYL
jgi:16S rRNA (guanine1516-N2)-methyltransferase